MGKLKPFDPLAKVRTSPKKVTSFELNPADLRNRGYECAPLREFPEELLACTNLKTLDIFRGLTGASQKIDRQAHEAEVDRPPEDRGDPRRALRLKNLISLDRRDVKKVPPGIGKLTRREVGLKALPSLAALKKLTRLGVGGNKLTALAESVATAPALKFLDYRGNPLPPVEKRAVDAMMKLPPSKRVANSKPSPKVASRPAPKKSRPAPKKKKPDASAPRRLGDVVSDNASLGILIGEAEVVAAFRGTKNDDWERARAVLDKADVGLLDVGKGKAVLVELGVGQGIASVWQGDDGRITLVEAIFEKDEDALDDDDRALFHEFIAAPLAGSTKRVAKLELENEDVWIMVLAPTTDDLTNVSTRMKKSSDMGKPCGSEANGILFDVVSTGWEIFVEATVRSSWRTGRRAVLISD